MSITLFYPRQEPTVCGFHVSRDMDTYILLDRVVSVKVFRGGATSLNLCLTAEYGYVILGLVCVF